MKITELKHLEFCFQHLQKKISWPKIMAKIGQCLKQLDYSHEEPLSL